MSDDDVKTDHHQHNNNPVIVKAQYHVHRDLPALVC